MFSVKLSDSQLQALDRTKVMVEKIGVASEVDYSALLYATLSWSPFGRPSEGRHCIYKVKAAVKKDCQKIDVQTHLEFVYQNGFWHIIAGYLELGEEYYFFQFGCDGSFFTRSYKNRFPV